MYFCLDVTDYFSDLKELSKNKKLNTVLLAEQLREIAQNCFNDVSFTVTLAASDQINNEHIIFAFVIEENEDRRYVIRYKGHN